MNTSIQGMAKALFVRLDRFRAFERSNFAFHRGSMVQCPRFSMEREGWKLVSRCPDCQEIVYIPLTARTAAYCSILMNEGYLVCHKIVRNLDDEYVASYTLPLEEQQWIMNQDEETRIAFFEYRLMPLIAKQ